MAKSDMFLSIETKRAGKVKGGSGDAGFEGQIEVVAWSWGMKSPSALGTASAMGKRSFSELRITKGVDPATTALMGILATNDGIKKAVLSVRTAAGVPHPFFTITIERGRISSHEVGSDDGLNLTETVSMAFEKVTVDYNGPKAGGMSFSDEVLAP